MTNRPEVTIPQSADYALKVRHSYKSGWKQRYFILSDAHWDSPECYIKLLHRHLKEAKDTDALIIDNGDFWDVIGGAGDKRASKGSVIEEHQGVNYLDRLVDSGLEEFREYADNFLYCGTGNHDWAVTIKKETDITRRWIDAMNDVRTPGLQPIYRAGYTGWIRFMFERNSGGKSSLFMKLEHGTGGNSPVTKGTIQANRRQVRTHGASFFVSGHIHEQWTMPYVVEVPNQATGRIELRKCQHLQVGSYKMDFRHDGVATWAMQVSGTPKPVGGIWLEFSSPDGDNIEWSTTPAWVDYPNLADYLRTKASIRRTA